MGERGMTLVELMVALPIAALIVASIAGIYYQMVVTRSYVDDSLAAYTELQRAGAWFSRDSVQAQFVTDNNYGNGGTVLIAVNQDAGITGTEVLALQWTDWDDNVIQVFYSLASVPGSSLKELHRTVKTNGSVTTSHLAAEHIDDSFDAEMLLDRTRFEWSSDEKDVIRLVATTEYGQESVTRMYEARPRSAV